jgi:hypothetical protein
MGNREYYEKKLEVISAIEDSQIKKPHHIPVAIYIQEADGKITYLTPRNPPYYAFYHTLRKKVNPPLNTFLKMSISTYFLSYKERQSAYIRCNK